MAATKKAQAAQGHGKDSWLRILMAAIGGLAVTAMLAVFVLEAVREAPDTPQIALSVVGVERAGAGWAALVRAHNGGKQTAAAVTIEGRLPNGETSQMILDYVPDGSSRSGGLMFESEPDAATLTLRVVGYADP